LGATSDGSELRVREAKAEAEGSGELGVGEAEGGCDGGSVEPSTCTLATCTRDVRFLHWCVCCLEKLEEEEPFHLFSSCFLRWRFRSV
jgi:hypothetical protein